MSFLKELNWRETLDAFFEKAQKVNKVQRLLIFVGSVLVLGGGFFALVYMPRTAEINRIEKEIVKLEQKIRTGKMWAQKLAKLKERQLTVEKEFARALTILPNEREIPSLLAGISQLGVDSKLQFRLFSPEKESIRNFYVEIPVAIEVGGRFRDVVLFLDKVRRMGRIVNIVDFSLKPQAELSTDLITRCKAVTYRFKSKADEEKEKAQKDQKKK